MLAEVRDAKEVVTGAQNERQVVRGQQGVREGLVDWFIGDGEEFGFYPNFDGTSPCLSCSLLHPQGHGQDLAHR